jgi:hypothetical protein
LIGIGYHNLITRNATASISRACITNVFIRATFSRFAPKVVRATNTMSEEAATMSITVMVTITTVKI